MNCHVIFLYAIEKYYGMFGVKVEVNSIYESFIEMLKQFHFIMVYGENLFTVYFNNVAIFLTYREWYITLNYKMLTIEYSLLAFIIYFQGHTQIFGCNNINEQYLLRVHCKFLHAFLCNNLQCTLCNILHIFYYV